MGKIEMGTVQIKGPSARTPEKSEGKVLVEIFDRLQKAYGPMHWWPADEAFEVMVGAILTQNTSWKNVEKAISRLKTMDLLDIYRLHTLGESQLAKEIRSSGYYRVKARRLKHLIEFIMAHYNGDIGKMFSEELGSLRPKLLQVNGIGPETADSILLYAGQKPIFVIDAYTKRILLRHGLASRGAKYEDLQRFFMENLPRDVHLYNEYHALLVYTAKDFCRKAPKCENCPLLGLKFEQDQKGPFQS